MLNNIKKRLYAVVLIMAMLMTIIVPVNVSAANVGSGLLTVDKYKEYLKSESYEDFKKFISFSG